MRWRAAVWAVVTFGLACAPPAATAVWWDRPEGATRIRFMDYRGLWRDIERCSGRRSDYRAVTWYLVDAADDSTFVTLGLDEPSYASAWPYLGIIAIAAPLIAHVGIVRHEIAHMIASPDYHNPDVFQRGPCAPLVVCWTNCLTDTLPPPGVVARKSQW